MSGESRSADSLAGRFLVGFERYGLDSSYAPVRREVSQNVGNLYIRHKLD